VSDDIDRPAIEAVRQSLANLRESFSDAPGVLEALSDLEDIISEEEAGGESLDWQEILRGVQILRRIIWPPQPIDAFTSAVLSAPALVKSSARTRPPPAKLVVLVLLWLVLIGAPVAGEKLPAGIQTMLSTEVGTVALGLAITQAMNQKK
jgi:hypothetical protein